MLRTTFATIWARKRRVAATSISVVLGVAFLLSTLVLGDTMERSFTQVFRTDNAGTDVVVRNATTIGADDDRIRGTLPADATAAIESVDGVAVAVPQITGSAQLIGADGEPIGGQGPPTFARSWVDDEALDPFELAEGRAPAADDEIAIDARSAEVGGLAVGDRTTIRTPEPVEVTVAGIVTFGGSDSMNGATYVGLTYAAAEDLLAEPGEVSRILVRGDGSVEDDELRDRIAGVVPDEAEALTGGELAAEDMAAAESDFLGFVRTFLVAFAVVALVVAAFTIHNTFTIVIAQRSQETALLRAVGASRRQVLGSVVVEALVVGSIAVTVGIGVGVGLAAGLRQLLEGFGMELSGTGLVLTGSAVAIAAAVGIVTTLVASLVPAVRASRTAPIAALRATDAEAPRLSRVRTGTGLVVSAGGAVLAGTATSAGSPLVAAGLGALLLIVGVVLLGPAIARPAAFGLGAPIAALRGQPGVLARRNAMRNPRRTAASALALVIGTTVVALFATFGSSLRLSIDQTVDRRFGGDLVISPDSFSAPSLSPELTPAVAALPEVERSTTLTNAVVTHEGETRYPTAVDPQTVGQLMDLDVQAGDVAQMGAGEIAVSTSFAEAEDLALGSEVVLGFVDGAEEPYTVAAVYDGADLVGELAMTQADWARHATRPSDVAILIDLADGVDLEQGRSAVQAVADEFAAPAVMDRQEFVDSVAGEVDQLLVLVYGLLGLAVLIALLGIANTLALSIHERRRELGLLRAVGLTRAGVRATVRWESVITAVLGTGIGLALGTALGWTVVRAMAVEEGFISFDAPTTTLAVVLALAAAAGVLAAVRPAHRAARIDVLAAIADR